MKEKKQGEEEQRRQQHLVVVDGEEALDGDQRNDGAEYRLPHRPRLPNPAPDVRSDPVKKNAMRGPTRR
eukprot:2465195-Rhodomonas_salina.1